MTWGERGRGRSRKRVRWVRGMKAWQSAVRSRSWWTNNRCRSGWIDRNRIDVHVPWGGHYWKGSGCWNWYCRCHGRWKHGGQSGFDGRRQRSRGRTRWWWWWWSMNRECQCFYRCLCGRCQNIWALLPWRRRARARNKMKHITSRIWAWRWRMGRRMALTGSASSKRHWLVLVNM